jgi:ABC-type transport system substrate-binding protein
MLFSGNNALRFFIIAFIFFFCGCGKKEAYVPGKPGEIKIRLENDPTTLDPAFIVDVPGGSIAAKIYNGLVRYDDSLKAVGDLAERYEVSSDGKEYTFRLRKGVRFHCGREFTARDAAYSLERVLSKETQSPRSRVLDRITGAKEFSEGKAETLQGISVQDPYTLSITLAGPYAPFLSQLTMPTASIVCRDCLEKCAGKQNNFCGTGPYLFREWKHDKTLTLGANKNYFGSRPEGVESITYHIIPEDFTAAAELVKGRIDVMEIPVSLLAGLKGEKNPLFDIVDGMTLSTYYLGFNCQKPYLQDPETRRAIAMAVNKDSIIKNLMQDTAVKALGPIPPVLGGHMEKELLPYDFQKAADILQTKDLGGVTLRLFANSTSQNVDIMSAIEFDLRNAGLKVQIEMRDWTTLKEAVDKGETDLFFLSWWADIPDGIDFLFPTFHSKNSGPAGNRSFFSDAEVDGLIEKAERTAGEQERNCLYREISEKIVEKSPWVFLWHKKSFYAASKRISGYRIYPMYNMDKGEEYKIKNEK